MFWDKMLKIQVVIALALFSAACEKGGGGTGGIVGPGLDLPENTAPVGTTTTTSSTTTTTALYNTLPSVSFPSLTVSEGQAVQVDIIVSDPDGDTVSLSCDVCPTGSSLSGNTFNWVPGYTSSGVHNIRIAAHDGVGFTSKEATITVNNTNRPPEIGHINSRNITTGSNLSIDVSLSDPDGDAVTLTGTSLPTNSALVGNTFVFSPTVNEVGTHVVGLIASDGLATHSKSFTVTVSNSNSAPVLTAPDSQTIREGLNLNFTVSATDADGDAIALSASGVPAGATFNTSTGQFSWTPNCSQEGTYTVTFRATDGLNFSDKATSIEVTHKNCYGPVWNVNGATSTASHDRVSWNIGYGSDGDGPVSYHFVAQYSCAHPSVEGWWGVEFYPATNTVLTVNYTYSTSTIKARYFKVYIRDTDGAASFRIFKAEKAYTNNMTMTQMATTNESTLCGGGPVYSNSANPLW